MMYIYQLARHRPRLREVRLIAKGVRDALGPDYDVATHFTPRYNPWEQRLCLVPDADMFRAIKSGRASVVTDHIESFTENGIQLEIGQATRSRHHRYRDRPRAARPTAASNWRSTGASSTFGKTLAYKGLMVSGVPNFASVFGYINASWTLKSDLICTYVCRLLKLMDRKGMRQVTPRNRDETAAAPFVENFSSGYMQRALASWPKQGSKRAMARVSELHPRLRSA